MWNWARKIWAKVHWLSAVVGAVIALAGSVGTYYVFVTSWVDAKIVSAVDGRLKPYENLLQAQALLRNGEPDIELELLRQPAEAFTRSETGAGAKGSAELPMQGAQSALTDVLIEAARDSSNPRKYGGIIKAIERKYDSGELPNYGWQLLALGWYYQRAGDLRKAEEYFLQAIDALETQPLLSEAAYAHWGRCLIALIRGNVPLALEQYRIAARQNPLEFRPDVFPDRLGMWLKERGYNHLRDNETFQQSLPVFLQTVQSMT